MAGAVGVLAVTGAVGGGVVLQQARQQGAGRSVGFAAHAAVQADVRGRQGALGPLADAAAHQHVHLQGAEQPGQRAVALALGVHDLAGGDGLPVGVVDLKLLGVAEVLEHLTVFVGNCDSHNLFSFRLLVLGANLPLVAARAAAGRTPAVAQAERAALNLQRAALHQHRGQLLAGALVNFLHRGAGDLHALAALLLRKALGIDQPDGLVFVHGQNHRGTKFRHRGGRKGGGFGVMADSAAFCGPGHGRSLLLGCKRFSFSLPEFRAYVNYNATLGNLCHKKHRARAEVLFDALRRNAAAAEGGGLRSGQRPAHHRRRLLRKLCGRAGGCAGGDHGVTRGTAGAAGPRA